MNDALRRTIDTLWRIESARIIGAVARMVRDVGVAEDIAQDALVAALEHWPAEGLPDNPAAWLMATARNKALDRLRQAGLQRRRREELGADADARGEHLTPDGSEQADADDVGDDLLRLIFIACHPVLTKEVQVALTLKLLGGLTTPEIARAFVQSEATIAQRIVRAKRTLAEAGVAFELPRGAELHQRLGSALESIYLIFNEGYTATAGDDLMRPALCEEALRLARMLAQLASTEREVHGLAALLELQHSRLRARTDGKGEPVLLLDQNRAQWDWLLIGRGLAALEAARRLPGEAGPYELQAVIASCHARAREARGTDWAGIVAAYDALRRIMPAPVVALNRAVAVSRALGPSPALALVDAIVAEGRLAEYHLLPAVRGDLLVSLHRLDEARAEFERAASLARNERERALLIARARATSSSRP
ncbi:MAG: sigma-70 family RNA polymerase sigma factor [Gammaproteobacteria bacterium]|nr:sigma-70 family RNA polymerase sigma factor [Gammaproteobacteria bacterium]